MANLRHANKIVLAAVLLILALAAIYIQANRFAATPIRAPALESSASSDKPATGIKDSEVAKTVGRLSAATAMSSHDAKAPSEISKRRTSVLSGVDESVAGQPFEISASIIQGCVDDSIECPLVMASVAKMVKEPRDAEWAARMEETIQAVADMGMPGEFIIRNLECRTTTCMLEVEVRPGPFPRYDSAIKSVLQPNAMINSSEQDSSGVHYVVELMDFSRR